MQVTLTLPEKQFIAESPAAVAAKLKLYAALGLYQAGQISIGAACELAGVNRYVFLEVCSQAGIPIQTQTSKEIIADFEALGRGVLHTP